MNIDRAKFLLENRGGPSNTLPVTAAFGAGNIHKNGITTKEFAFLSNLMNEVNDRLADYLVSTGKSVFRIDLVGVLQLVTDTEEEIRWHKVYIIHGETETSSGTISIADIPNSVLVFASSFFK